MAGHVLLGIRYSASNAVGKLVELRKSGDGVVVGILKFVVIEEARTDDPSEIHRRGDSPRRRTVPAMRTQRAHGVIAKAIA